MFAYVKKGVVTDISTVQLEMKGYQEFEYEGIGNPFFQDWKIVEYSDVKSTEQLAREKHQLVLYKLMSTVEYTDLEGEVFTDEEIGDVITAKVFWGNPYAQVVLQAKFMKAMMKQLTGTADENDLAVITKAEYVNEKVNEIRRVFELGDM